VCKAHGVWLDHGEIDKILSFIRGGGLERARRRQIEKLEDERRRLRAERAAATGSYDPRLDSGRVFGEGRAAAGQIGLGVFLDWLF
jgi:Zn-finger nucleic acid-binding protein